jgi:ArsR family transcriptional regulator
LSDPIRLSIPDKLGRDERRVCDLQGVPVMAPNRSSYHLRILRESGLVASPRRWVDYRLPDDAAVIVRAALPSPPFEAASR